MTPQRISPRRKPRRTPTGRVNLGPGGPIPDRVIIHVFATRDGKEFVRDFNLDIITLTRQFRGSVYLPIQSFLNGKIHDVVPQDTKDLSISMKDSMVVPQNVTLDDFKMVLGADVNYAGYVQQMPQSWLRHPTSRHKNTSSRSGRKAGSKQGFHLKIDPSARPGSFNLVLYSGRAMAQRLYPRFRTSTLVPALRHAVNLMNKKLVNTPMPLVRVTNYHNLANKLFRVRYN